MLTMTHTTVTRAEPGGPFAADSPAACAHVTARFQASKRKCTAMRAHSISMGSGLPSLDRCQLPCKVGMCSA